MKRKLISRPMIMLELILAVAIIGIASSVIIGTPAKIYQKQLAQLYELELEREAENFFADLLINFKSLHSFDSLLKEKKTYFYKDLKIDLESYATQSFHLTYKLWTRSEKESNNNTFYKLLGCQLFFDNTSSRDLVQKKPIFFTLLTRISPKRSWAK